MKKIASEVVSLIDKKIGEIYFNTKIEKQISDLKSIDNIDIDVIDKILMLFENNPEFDFGSPGSLTHYLERFYKKGYEKKLISSIQRRPTGHTLWMLNRIINSASTQEKKEYLLVIKNIYSDNRLEQTLRDRALKFYQLHE